MQRLIKLVEVVKREYVGEIEIDVKDKRGNILQQIREPNIVKIFAKECLSHRLASSVKWDPLHSNTDGSYGAWVDSDVDPDEDFSVKYILLGASFDENYQPLDNKDERFYIKDSVSGFYVPIKLGPGAEYDGGLINAIPINEGCGRPIKKIEDFRYEATYQPASTPFLQGDVRAVNNILICETTVETSEYNGMTNMTGDYFTITEVALAAGRTTGILSSTEYCNVNPNDIFLEGPYSGTLFGSTAVRLNSGCTTDGDDWCPFIRVGDQIKITGGTGGDLGQVSPFYMVMNKECNGSNLILDRVPLDSDDNPITGEVEVWRDTLRIFSHRILTSPIKKISDVSLVIRWRIIFS